MHKLFLFTILLFSATSFGQQTEWWNIGKSKDKDQKESNEEKVEVEGDTVEIQPGKVSIKKDPRIEKLIAFKGAKIPPATGPKIDGFRIQIYFDQDRSSVNSARAKVLQLNASAETYVEYKAPNYNLLYGNFRTRLEAEKARAELMSLFPESIIVKDKIYFPKLKETGVEEVKE
jgi:hypothetical protein